MHNLRRILTRVLQKIGLVNSRVHIRVVYPENRMVQRLTYRRRHAYNTASNKIKPVKTPGGKLAAQYRVKVTSFPKCGDCGAKLLGVSGVRPKQLRTLKQRQRKVARPYGGSRCGTCVRNRIVRAFLIEEQKIVKQVLRSRAVAKKDEAPAEKPKKKPAAKKAAPKKKATKP